MAPITSSSDRSPVTVAAMTIAVIDAYDNPGFLDSTDPNFARTATWLSSTRHLTFPIHPASSK